MIPKNHKLKSKKKCIAEFRITEDNHKSWADIITQYCDSHGIDYEIDWPGTEPGLICSAFLIRNFQELQMNSGFSSHYGSYFLAILYHDDRDLPLAEEMKSLFVDQGWEQIELKKVSG